jgi:DNA-binding NarL/FixJ family response regulator
MPGNGVFATEAIRQSLPSTRIVLLTATPDADGVLSAARAEADGYLPKDVSPSRLPPIVCAVAESETSFPGGCSGRRCGRSSRLPERSGT